MGGTSSSSSEELPAARPDRKPGPHQGPLPDQMLAAMKRHDSVRMAVQARLDELEEVQPPVAGEEVDVSALGFDSPDDLLAEAERLQHALRDAANGGKTVQEELDEPGPAEVEWDPVEYDQVCNAVADLEAALESATAGQQRSVLESNLEDAKARLDALERARIAES